MKTLWIIAAVLVAMIVVFGGLTVGNVLSRPGPTPSASPDVIEPSELGEPTTPSPSEAAPQTSEADPVASPSRTRARVPLTHAPNRAPVVAPATEAPASAYYANCSAARAAGVTPLHAGDTGYRSGLDRDHDGTACE